MITVNDLKKANQALKAISIKGKDYIMVNKRIIAFRDLCPNGSITTEIIKMEDGIVTMKATIKDESGSILGTGLAQEKETSSYINKTSYIENCETSAVGRALGMCGIGIDDSLASAEEIANAIVNQNKDLKVYATDVEKKTYMDMCNLLGVDSVEILKRVGWKSGKMTAEQHGKALIILKEIEESKNEVDNAK